MKRIIYFFIILMFFPVKVNAISAKSYVVMDMNSKRVLEGKNIYEKNLIASTTKIMTAYLAIKYGNLSDQIKADESILKATGSSIYLQIGEVISLEHLLYGLLLRSGNDAAILIAKHISGSMDNFAKLMNDTAKEIGMRNTQFYNSHGLEENNYNTSTSYDMALLMIECMKSKTFRTITITKKITIKTNYKTYVWYNKNKLLSSYEYTTGGKTGYTKKARRTLISTATKDDKNIVIVTLNDSNDFANHKHLYEKNFNKYQLVSIVDKNTYILRDNSFKKGKLYLKNSFSALLTANEVQNLSIVEEINQKSKKNVIGSIKVYIDKKEIYQDNIYYQKYNAIKKINNFWEKIKSWLM